jgi:hypothetical protein
MRDKQQRNFSKRVQRQWSWVLSGLLASAILTPGVASAALSIVVDTLYDAADTAFMVDAMNCAATGTVSDLPGTDGQISLREAIIAAENTPGKNKITFGVSGTIPLSSVLPFLCKGNTTINGDNTGDNVPDITLDGGGTVSRGLRVFSGKNTINAVKVQNLSGGGEGIIVFHDTRFPALSAANNKITNNSVTGGRFPFGVVAGTSFGGGFSGIVKNTTLTGNSGSGGSVNGLIVITQDTVGGSSISKTTIKNNTFTNNTRFGILVLGLSPSASITGVTISGNTVSSNLAGIGIENFGATASGTSIVATVHNNIITGNSFPDGTAGLFIAGGFNGATNNIVKVTNTGNLVSGNTGSGIGVIGGLDGSSDNLVEVSISGDTIENNAVTGLGLLGGLGAFNNSTGTSANNTVNAKILKNIIQNNGRDNISIASGIGSADGRAGAIADNNVVSISSLKSNELRNAGRYGIALFGAGSGLANDNVVQSIVRGSPGQVSLTRNTSCGNTSGDIAVIGGFLGDMTFPPTVGTGNIASAKILRNTAPSITSDNGVAGNTADVTLGTNTACP